MVASTESEGHGELADPWYVSESLPLGTDVAPTIPIGDLGFDLPSGIGLLLQRDAENQKQFCGGALAKDGRSPRGISPKTKEIEEPPSKPKEVEEIEDKPSTPKVEEKTKESKAIKG